MSSKLRETLRDIQLICYKAGVTMGYDVACGIIKSKSRAALAEQKCEAKWELGFEYEFAYCSHCGHQQWASWGSHREASENIGEFHKEYKFCPNCGSEMKGANDEQ